MIINLSSDYLRIIHFKCLKISELITILNKNILLLYKIFDNFYIKTVNNWFLSKGYIELLIFRYRNIILTYK